MRNEALRLDQLPDDALLRVLALLELEDVLHLSRTAVRLHTLVTARAEPVWKALSQSTFINTDAPQAGTTWANHYRERHVDCAKHNRLQRLLKVMRAQSAVQVPFRPKACCLTCMREHTRVRVEMLASVAASAIDTEHGIVAKRPEVQKSQELERDVRDVKQKIRATAEDAQRMAAEHKELERTRQAQVALSSWQPQAVRSRQQQLVAQKPIEPRWRVAALQHARADAEVHLRGLQKSLGLRQQQLTRKRKALQALQEA